MDRPRIFVSAVTKELGAARRAVAATLRSLGYDPVSEDDFPTGYGELRAWLYGQIDQSEGLIQLVGETYGAEPPDSDPGYGRVSYTQLEFLYATRKDMKTWVIVAGERFPRDKAADDLDLPEDVGEDAEAYQAERRLLQRRYVENLESDNHLRHTVQTYTELENTILRLRDDLSELRRSEQQWRRRLEHGIEKLHTEVQEVAAIDAAKIRAHLEQSVDETFRRELADADGVTSWREREKLREAAEQAHKNRRARIHDLVATFIEIESAGTATAVFAEMQRILQEEGVDEAVGYIASKRGVILEQVKRRTAAARERNRADLQPLLQTAALLETKGEDAEARIRYEEVLEVDRDWPEALHRYFWFLADQGDTARVRGSLADAERDYAHAHRLAQRLTAGDPANTEWQRDLSVSHERIGNVLKAQGDGPGALAAYRQGLAIAEALAARDSASTEWQRDLSVSQERIGNVLVAQGDRPGALAAYRQGLAIREALATRDPANTGWQRNLSISHNKIGDVLVAQGDGPGALAAYRNSLEIREALVARDPANTEWQRDLSVSRERIGDVLKAQGDGPGALAAYRQGLAIREALATRDPANTEWQRNLSISHNKIGDVLAAQGDRPGTLDAYRKSHQIFEALAARDPANTEWQRDLSISHNKTGDVLVAQGDRPGALDAYRESHQIFEALAARDPANTEWQRDLSISHNKTGDVLVAQGDGPGALDAYRKSHQIVEALAARDPANTQWQVDLAVSYSKLGTFEYELAAKERRGYLNQGRRILIELKANGQLMPNQDWVEWFDDRLSKLPPDLP